MKVDASSLMAEEGTGTGTFLRSDLTGVGAAAGVVEERVWRLREGAVVEGEDEDFALRLADMAETVVECDGKGSVFVN